MKQFAVTAYLANEQIVQTATNDLTESLGILIRRLELADLPGLSLSAEQVAVMAQLMLVRFNPPPSSWTTSWTNLLNQCRRLSGFRTGLLQGDEETLLAFQAQLQQAVDAVGPLTASYAELEQ